MTLTPIQETFQQAEVSKIAIIDDGYDPPVSE